MDSGVQSDPTDGQREVQTLLGLASGAASRLHQPRIQAPPPPDGGGVTMAVHRHVQETMVCPRVVPLERLALAQRQGVGRADPVIRRARGRGRRASSVGDLSNAVDRLAGAASWNPERSPFTDVDFATGSFGSVSEDPIPSFPLGEDERGPSSPLSGLPFSVSNKLERKRVAIPALQATGPRPMDSPRRIEVRRSRSRVQDGLRPGGSSYAAGSLASLLNL